ncbi:hypothetical protein V9T40_013902 [Parthenolecanium corni]|uniref:Eukaryotic initiation factor 4E n=1 Tax=Parthenolecanium corni TaxID=536013 RepID=A0AAN9TFP0_9HEMI
MNLLVCWNSSKLQIFSEQILLIIGGELDDFANEVCGAILNVRARCDKIAVWTPNVNKANEILGIGRKLKDCFNYEKKLKFNYESHESVEKKSSKNRYLHTL